MNKYNLFSLLFSLSVIATTSLAQTLPQNWHNLDPFKDQYLGTSTDKTYHQFLKKKTSQKVIVAVIDAGVEVDHPDLKGKIWTNLKEIPGNQIDDDHNGYVDDIHGWDFIGGKVSDVNFDTYESLRLYLKYQKELDKNASFATSNPKEYETYLRAKKDYESKKEKYTSLYDTYKKIVDVLNEIQSKAKNDSVSLNDIDNYNPTEQVGKGMKAQLQILMKYGVRFKDFRKDIDKGFEQIEGAVKFNLNPDFNPRGIVGDNYDDFTVKNYGNNEVEGPDADHGTHVAGIIAAIRGNDSSAEGVAEFAEIMVLRAVPNGDERDKDVANAIRYAVDNGAKIINMSFGKPFSPEKHLVDDAVKYALSKDVLLVHAAGNDALDLDQVENKFYPCPTFLDQNIDAKAQWIEVGALSSNGTPANFSNYGRTSVDLFAPGVKIYSTIPDAKYDHHDGTSMAAPVVAGVAALIRSYYPHLTAKEVKTILMNSVFKINTKVQVPGKKRKRKFSKLCISGGAVSTYNAILMLELGVK